MNEPWSWQLDRLLEEDLLPDDRAAVLAQLNDPQALADLARRAALVAALHKSLSRRRLQATAIQQAGLAISTVTPQRPSTNRRLARFPMGWNQPAARRAVVGMTALAASIGLAIFVGQQGGETTAAAASAIDRMNRAAAAQVDRVYEIRVLDPQPDEPADGADGSRRNTEGAGRKPTIDGARLTVSQGGRYVLLRRFSDGQTFVTGSDGTWSWAVPPRGAVRVSHDPRRFRGAVPGEQQELPFHDLKLLLTELSTAYDLQVVRLDSADPRLPARQRLDAVKRSSEQRGPREVQLWFDPRTGVVSRLQFSGLPQAKGGPRTVALELVEEVGYQAAFFTHGAHHDAERRVIDE